VPSGTQHCVDRYACIQHHVTGNSNQSIKSHENFKSYNINHIIILGLLYVVCIRQYFYTTTNASETETVHWDFILSCDHLFVRNVLCM
jgi:hypothetical protein